MIETWTLNMICTLGENVTLTLILYILDSWFSI